jgi:hypothetical protein
MIRALIALSVQPESSTPVKIKRKTVGFTGNTAGRVLMANAGAKDAHPVHITIDRW